jgi:murein DD-endopeptidase MepM/ murein hydrolase activator NlpD
MPLSLRRRIALAALLLGAMPSAALGAAPHDLVGLSANRDQGQRNALLENFLAGPVTVRLWAEGKERQAITLTLSARETREVGPFSGQAELRAEAQPGAPLLLPPEQRLPYSFPLGRAQGWRITQGFGGSESHRSPANWHAFDIAALQGTPVIAARAGTVMQVVDAFTEGGTDARLKDRANLIRVLHEDGSMGLYAHIAPGSARVQAGDTVQAGSPLAAVGNVGWSTAPHLHFSVQINDGRELLSLPFTLLGPDGATLPPGV